MNDTAGEEIKDILSQAKVLAARYYRLSGKPLGVTGELAELAAADALGLDLCPARETGFDAWDPARPGHRVQIKARAVDPMDRYRGRCPAIKFGNLFDTALLVLLDKNTLDLLEIWEATEDAVAARLTAPGGKARNERGAMGISQFKSIARRVWPI